MSATAITELTIPTNRPASVTDCRSRYRPIPYTAAAQEIIAYSDCWIPVGASMPANNAVTIPVRNASCVSTSITTNSEAAAKGMAKFQKVGSLNGAVFMPLATLSLSVKPTRINPVSTTMAEPTRANALVFERDNTDAVLRCSVNFHTAQYTAKTIINRPSKLCQGRPACPVVFMAASCASIPG